MKFFIYVLVDVCLGYVLQALGCAICVFALNRLKITSTKLLALTAIFTAIMFIRKIEFIDYGFRLILSLIAFILISVLLFKTSIYHTTLSVLISTVTIMLCEALTMALLYLIVGADKVNMIMSSTSYSDKIVATLYGVPTNFILIAVMIVLYFVLPKKRKRVEMNGDEDKKVSI